ncbi:MAG: YraN family protein [Chloroflexales bacterium]|nr:YraN family protein [Chloroflexales bacterium]
MLNARQALGKFGEDAATAYLERLGYGIVARGWRCRTGEVDIVARRGEQLVFVEVRARRGTATTPEESITAKKQARLVRLAYAYLDAHAISPESNWRIDVMAVVVSAAGRITRLTHIESAIEL